MDSQPLFEYYINKYNQHLQNLSLIDNKYAKNIIFRIKSIYFHLDVLATYQYEIRIGNGKDDDNKDCLIKATYIFEDLIFNLSTFYDYYANLLVNICLNRTEKFTWNKLFRTIKNNRNFFHNENLISTIIECNKNVNQLQEYRSQIIHYNVENVEFKNIDKNNKTIQVPKKLSKALSLEQLVNDSKDMNLRAIMEFLITITLDNGLIMLDTITFEKET